MLQALAESSLVFEVVYYVQSADETTYMDVQQAINFAIYRNFSERGIRLAQPGRALYVQETARVVAANER